MKAKKIIALLMAVVMLFTISGAAMAAEPEGVTPVAGEENITRAFPESVPWYFYYVEYPDGSTYTSPTTYMEIMIPSNDHQLIQTGPDFVSVQYETWYNNKKADAVYRFEWSYEIVYRP